MQLITSNTIKTNSLTRYYRIGRIIFHTLVGMMIAALMLPLANKPFKKQLIRWWCKYLLAAFNIRVICLGHVPPAGKPLSNVMFIGNHISWADIHALNSVVPLRFVAKSEIKSWPVFGYLANKANALFIDRSKRHDAARIVEMTTQSLIEGDCLCLFPEGTTTDGTEMKPFKSSLIQAAVHAKATIWPVAIHYPLPDGTANTKMAYAGDTTLQESMQNILLQKYPTVELHFLAPISIAKLAECDQDRRVLTLHIQELIRKQLNL